MTVARTLRVRYQKLGKVRFLSHRDLARVWERALRRAELPVAYSQGYTPRPRLHFGLALATGEESVAEYLDVDLRTDDVTLDGLTDRLSAVLPDGIDALATAFVEKGSPSLQEAVTSCSWRIRVDAPADELVTAAGRLKASGRIELTRTRKGKVSTDDVRPAILALIPGGGDADEAELEAELATKPRALRPTELIELLGWGDHAVVVRRTEQWIGSTGARRAPLEPPPAGRGERSFRPCDVDRTHRDGVMRRDDADVRSDRAGPPARRATRPAPRGPAQDTGGG